MNDHIEELTKRYPILACSAESIYRAYEIMTQSFAGGGGFFIFYTPADRQEAVKDALKDLLFVPFRFEDSGTEILYYRPEDYVPEQSKKENFYEESIDYRNDRYGRVAFG